MSNPFVVVQARKKNEICSCCRNTIKPGHHFAIFHTSTHDNIQLCFVCIKNMKKLVSDQIPLRPHSIASELKDPTITHLY